MENEHTSKSIAHKLEDVLFLPPTEGKDDHSILPYYIYENVKIEVPLNSADSQLSDRRVNGNSKLANLLFTSFL